MLYIKKYPRWGNTTRCYENFNWTDDDFDFEEEYNQILKKGDVVKLKSSINNPHIMKRNEKILSNLDPDAINYLQSKPRKVTNVYEHNGEQFIDLHNCSYIYLSNEWEIIKTNENFDFDENDFDFEEDQPNDFNLYNHINIWKPGNTSKFTHIQVNDKYLNEFLKLLNDNNFNPELEKYKFDNENHFFILWDDNVYSYVKLFGHNQKIIHYKSNLNENFNWNDDDFDFEEDEPIPDNFSIQELTEMGYKSIESIINILKDKILNKHINTYELNKSKVYTNILVKDITSNRNDDVLKSIITNKNDIPVIQIDNGRKSIYFKDTIEINNHNNESFDFNEDDFDFEEEDDNNDIIGNKYFTQFLNDNQAYDKFIKDVISIRSENFAKSNLSEIDYVNDIIKKKSNLKHIIDNLIIWDYTSNEPLWAKLDNIWNNQDSKYYKISI